MEEHLLHRLTWSNRSNSAIARRVEHLLVRTEGWDERDGGFWRLVSCVGDGLAAIEG
jgi:hypothetical protein